MPQIAQGTLNIVTSACVCEDHTLYISRRGAMASIAENREVWNDPDHWSRAGDHWSEETWGSPYGQWHGSIYPRCFAYLKGRILEIAPGQGRWTQFLRGHCDSLIGVDLSDVCTQYCRRRFAEHPSLQFETNDGLTLPMVGDGSIDFAFSFDSLVHADPEVLDSYVRELARVLKPRAVAFLHHSNLADVRWPLRTRLKHKLTREPINAGWREWRMSAAKMRSFVTGAGMSTIQQELVPWVVEEPVLIDCMTTIVNQPDLQCTIVRNHRFLDEAAAVKRILSI
jgi:hypothetical protein